MSNPIFRKAALDGLSSPEQLNQLVQVTPARAWIALWASAVLLAAILAWAAFGTLPSRMAGRGVLIHDGGTFNVVAVVDGVVADMEHLSPGQHIAKGQVLGRIIDPALGQQIASAEAYVRTLAAATGPGAQETRAQAQQELDRLRFEAALDHRVVSDHDGEVVEVMATNGHAVKPGDPIVSMEYGESPLRAVLYLPPSSNAKLLRPGMTTEISPVTSLRERDGYLIGRVRSVSKYPATQAGMLALLPNPALVDELAPEGPPIAVEVELVPDPRSQSGYRWSSPAGDALEISSGTLCSGSFVLESRRPIALLFPFLDKSSPSRARD
ncbi:NHLP bacteriocin system secretion protein [Nitrospirillum viridazoti]|uniref:NHLP bacteriocin system secretion protein n=1 Tax=Nitrospirillum viridazoti CBAmc TaxID=1441467 RepID=A0A248K0X7_9PROT|nr:NHLP bacteriocin system secretion protein [Nitrospirillum amazonense]ASG24084.1 NHLP bacteriocin system secretion protein [Nitrospirillum amazonense CBAmc]TWB40933.1 NHLM bacteriocin system secretion protein [Nitrospirillum amazonense]